MAALPAGVQYGLSSESSYKENKDLVFVKLTDSALKAIEDFIRSNRGKFGATPTIEFLPGNEGVSPEIKTGDAARSFLFGAVKNVENLPPTSGSLRLHIRRCHYQKISIPGGPSVQQPPATFHFSLSNNADMEGPQGSFECVRGSNMAMGGRRLDACGPLTRRMRVHANDDSYEATKSRMAKTVAEEQSKCTRVIKPNQSDIGRRVKRPGVTNRSGSGTIRPVIAPVQPPPFASQIPSGHVTGPTRSLAEHHGKRPNIKERLIQLLALKPFKKPELYLRLTSEGIDEKEKRVINTILQQISSLKDNCYQIHRHLWNDVNEDWPYYSVEEKMQLKRRKPQNLTPPLSSDSSQSLSPRGSPGKRSASGNEETPAGKKQRISHYKKQPRATTPSSGYATGASSGERHASDTEDAPVKKDNGYTLTFNTAKEFCPSPPMVPRVAVTSPPCAPRAIAVPALAVAPPSTAPSCRDFYQHVVKRDPSPKPPSPQPVNEQHNDSGGRNDQSLKDITPAECLENMEASMTNLSWLDDDFNMEELEREWPPIVCPRERREYKAEFASEYNEYREVYKRVARTAAIFARLERRLRAAPIASPDHDKISRSILAQYARTRSDPEYLRDRRRCHRLHAKLQLIKERVSSYDQQNSLSSERVAGVHAY